MAIAKPFASGSVEESRGAVRVPLLTLALVSAAGFAVVAFLAPDRPPTALDLDLERAVQAVDWGTLPAVLAVVALSRVYTGEHWPSDVLAGLLLGAAWTLFGLSVRRLSDPVLNG